MEKYLGKTVVVAKFIGADDIKGKFEIEGQTFEIEAIKDNGDFKSPLNREDEFPEPRTMKEFLMHPRKSVKRKFKKGDYTLLTLQRFLNTEKNKIIYKLQNALIYIRHLNVEDDLEYKGFVFKADDVQQFYKDEEENLPIFLIKFSSTKKENSEIGNIVSEILENDITLKMNFSFKSGENEFSKKIIVKEIPSEEFKDEEADYILLNDFVDMINKEENKNLIFTVSFFQNGTKKKNIMGKYEKIFLNNVKVKNPKKELDKILNEDLEAYYSPRKVSLDNNIFLEKETYGKIINDNGDTIMAPSLVSFKQSRNNIDENISFYLVSSIVPNIIEMRKRGNEFLKKSLRKETEKDNSHE